MADKSARQKSDAEQDLLYAIMAVQLGLASSREVIRAASDWALDRSMGLAQRLEQDGVVPEASSRMLRDMVAQAIAAHGGDTSQTLRTFGGESAVLESFGGSIVLSPEGEIVSSHTLESCADDEGGDSGECSESEVGDLKVTPVVRGRYSLRDRATDSPTLNPRLAEIGRGGIGRVLVAFDEHLGREVAVKELLPIRVGGSLDKVRVASKKPDQAKDGVRPVMSMEKVSSLVARFLREARVTGQLEHPNIVPVYELGRNADDTLYYTMKMVRGRTLSQALKECSGLADRLKLLSHFVDLCQAIAYAHSRGVVHRDLKPDNVMLGEFGETVVLDWGLAKVRGTQDLRGQDIEREIELLREVAGGHTVDGTAVGTPAYMSPEQADGKLEDIDERSDVWSLGAVLYQILTGRPPYEGSSAYEVIGKVLREQVTPVRQVVDHAPGELASVCEKALCRNRVGRYQSARDLADEINAYLTGGRVRAYEYRLGDLILRTVARHKMSFAVGGVALCLLLALGIWSYMRVVADRDRAQTLSQAADRARQEARIKMAEAHWEGSRSAMMRRDMLEARAKLRSSLEVTDSVAGRVLWSKTSQESLIWKKKLGALLYDLAYSPDGQVVAAAGHDGSIYLLNPHTAELRVLRGHEPWVATLAFSSDGSLLASAGSDKSVRIWEVASGRTLHKLEGHSGSINDLAFSPDGQILASCSYDKTIRLWSVRTGAEKLIINGDKSLDFFWSLQFSQDGQTLISGGRDNFIRLWSLADGQQRGQVRQSDKLKELVSALDLSPDGQTLASGGSGNEVYLWNMSQFGSGKSPESRISLKGHTDGIAEVAFHPGGQLLATGSYDNTVRIWNLEDDRGVEQARIEDHSAWVAGVSFSPDGKFLATGSEDQSIRLYGLPIAKTRKPISRGHTDSVSSLAIHPKGKLVASGGNDKSVRLWELSTGKVVQVLKGPKQAVRSLSFTAQGSLVAAGWDRILHTWSPEAQKAGQPSQTRSLTGSADLVHHFEISADERWIASSEYDRTIRIWDMASGQERRLAGHTNLVRALAFSPDSKLLASGSWDTTIRLWDAQSGKMIRELKGHSSEVSNVRFSPDGGSLVSASWDQTIRRWDLSSGQNQIISRYEGRLVVISHNPQGTLLATGDESGRIRIIDLHTGKGRTLLGHRDVVMDLRFSQDGRLLASASDDGTVRVWTVATGQPYWRAPFIFSSPGQAPLAYSQRGWFVPGQTEIREAPNSKNWLSAAQGARRVSLDPDGGSMVCLQTGDIQLEIWDRDEDRLVFQRRLAPIDQVLAFQGGCAVRAKGQVTLFGRRGKVQELAQKASSMALADKQVMVAAGGRILFFGLDGSQGRALPADVGVKVMLLIENKGQQQVAMGFADGTVEVLPIEAHASAKRNLSLEEVPSSQVVHMSPGPRGTIVLGYANGLLGLWDLTSGARLDHLKLHGPLAQTAIHKDKLYLVTELGDHLAWDLSIFNTAYCKLLQGVWQEIPVIWNSGRPQLRLGLPGHPCSAQAAPPSSQLP